MISGPSFLGLNQPERAPVSNSTRRRGSLSIDPNSAPSSSNLDYLLQDDEDQEEERRGGGGKFILILLALALAVGLGYLRWRNQGFGGLGAGTSKPPASAQTPDATPSGSSTPSSTTSTPADSPAPSTSATATPPTAATSAPAPAPASTQPATSPSSSAEAPAAASPTPNPANNTATAADATTAPATSGAPSSPAEGTTAAPSPKTTAPASDTPPPTSAKPSKTDDAPSAKPTAGLKPVVKVDPVSEAQKYIYGRGVPQNCDRGMRLLKPAADQANPKAMIEMGALYSAGLCTPHDLPTAYRWFALALRKDPDNAAVASDLQKLWGEMTQAERQLAIKLSQ